MTDGNTTQSLAKHYQEAGDPNGWFEAYYASTKGDVHSVVWADLAPGPCLVSWMEDHPPKLDSRAVVIGCGMGDDAEFLADLGIEVIGFDLSKTAIQMCKDRWTDTQVSYQVADLFDLPESWHKHFDLIYECNTIQALRGEQRDQSIPRIADLLAPGGSLLVSCRYRESTEVEDIMPLPLNQNDLDRFKDLGLDEIHFHTYDDDQESPVPHAFAVYQR